ASRPYRSRDASAPRSRRARHRRAGRGRGVGRGEDPSEEPPLDARARRAGASAAAMPELPEVETVRRMLEGAIPGRVIARAEVSRKRLRTASLAPLPGKLVGRAFGKPRRTGKFLLLDLDGGWTLLSHLGMSGRWLFWPPRRAPGSGAVGTD